MSPLLILTKESFLGLKNSVPNSFEERESEREERRLLEERKGEEGRKRKKRVETNKYMKGRE